MRITLAYGKTGLPIEVPDDRLMKVLSMRPEPPLADPRAAVAEAVEKPLAGPPLRQIAAGKKTACILICDITRPAPNAIVLPPILKVLTECGLRKEDIVILNATGLHRGNTPDELLHMVGPEVFGHWRIENHDAKDLAAHVNLGTTARGTPMWIDRRFVEADVRIATGYTEPHLMAGFSGGRKLVAPGVAAAITIQHIHSPQFMEHPSAREGVIEGNILHEEITGIAYKAGLQFVCNSALDEPRRATGIFAGEPDAAFRAGAAFVGRQVTDLVPEPADIVITSAGGFPLDLTYYQTVKGMTAAIPILRQGGTLLIASECAEGLGSHEFARLATTVKDIPAWAAGLTDFGKFVYDQWQLEKMVPVVQRGDVVLCGPKLPASDASRLPHPVEPTVESALGKALAKHGPNARIAVIPKGPYLMPRVA
jgi:nickel-dependent lactate racemase